MRIFKKDKPEEPVFSVKTVLALVGLMAIAVLLGVFVFSKTSLRLDEAQSLFQTSRDLPGLFNLVAQDVHVPGYHILLHFWTLLFGSDIVTARHMSLLFFVVTIPAVYYLGASIFNRRVGLFAALLLTLSPFTEWYGSEARMYSMLALVTVLHQIIFLKLFREGKAIHWILFVVTAIAGLYTHYFFSFVLLTDALFYFAYIRRFAKYSLIKFIFSAGIALAAFAPWVLYFLSKGAASNTQPSLGIPSSGDLFNTYAQFLFGFQVDYLNTIIISLWPALVLFAFFALRKSKRISPEVVFFGIAAALPVASAFALSITVKPFFLSRYLIVALPALFVLLAWFIDNYPKAIRRTLSVVFVVLIVGLLYIEVANPNTPVKEDYRGAVNYLNTNATEQDVIVLAAPFTIYPVEYYYKGQAALTTQPIWNRFEQGGVPAFDTATLPQETTANTASYQHAWLMLSYDQGYNSELQKYYDSHFERINVKKFSPGLSIYEYKLRYDDPITTKTTP